MADGLTVLLIISSTVAISTAANNETTICPRGPVVTFTGCCRLGNIVWDYVDTISVARILPSNYQPYMRRHQAVHIKELFEGPYLPVLEDIPGNCSRLAGTDWSKPTMGEMSGRQLRGWNRTDNIIMRSPSVMEQPVYLFYKDMKRTLQYKTEYVDAANKMFNNVSAQFLSARNLTNQTLTFVGVHVRRSDYLNFLRPEQKANATFFNFAFDYFRNRTDLGKCVFVLATDDPEWAKENLVANKTNSDVFLANGIAKLNATAELVLLSLCNHSIFDYGSFGLWGAVYSGGEVVTTSSYSKAHPFIRWKNFHFFDPMPTKELKSITYLVKFEEYSVF